MKKVRRGTVREDGKVFFRFQKLAGKTYEVWLLPEAYKLYCDKQKAISASRDVKVPLSKSPEDRAKRSARHRRWRNATPLRRLACNVRSRVREVLTENKTRASLKYVGCSLPELRLHLEKQFLPGMSWAASHGRRMGVVLTVSR